MEKILDIKILINSTFGLVSTANLEDWNSASIDDQKTYVKSKIKEFLEDNLDQIIDNSEITF